MRAIHGPDQPLMLEGEEEQKTNNEEGAFVRPREPDLVHPLALDLHLQTNLHLLGS